MFVDVCSTRWFIRAQLLQRHVKEVEMKGIPGELK